MKKTLFLFIATLSIIFLVGCGNTVSKSTNVKTNSNSTVNDKSTTKVTKFEEKSDESGTNNVVTKTEKSVRLFYYNGVDDKIYYQDTTVNVTDGALVTAIINALKTNHGDQYCALDSSIAVKSAKLDTNKSLLTVNFGTTFVNTMNLGGGVETSVLQAVVNSLGYNFGVSNIYITVNGVPYSSGHIILKDGDSFKVDYSNIVKLK